MVMVSTLHDLDRKCVKEKRKVDAREKKVCGRANGFAGEAAW